ncbi:MAG: alpha/beta hydrolase domain-containing protein [Bryobacteraceae bacterium]
MFKKNNSMVGIALLAAGAMIFAMQFPMSAQQQGGFGGGAFKAGGGPAPAPAGKGGAKGPAGPPLPTQPTAVALPTLSAKITGPGAIYDSAVGQWPGHDVTFYKYDTDEYFVSGTANSKPYKTRLVIRKPADNARFSGLILAEAMHPAGNAHGFEYNAIYLMSSGHIAAEILTGTAAVPLAANKERYADLTLSNDQTNEILAQVGALVRSAKGPLAGLTVRKMVLFGTSASSAILTNYLPAHMVYRTPEMTHVYDGFMPTSNGTVIASVDVPVIQVPTQHEYENSASITTRQDGDAAGDQYRDFEFAGMGHLDARNNLKRLPQSACVNPLSQFPLEAYMSVALYHLMRWVDQGIVPPKADRILSDRNRANDGSLMALDAHGNAQGGIRNPYLDLPTAKYTARNTAAPVGGNAQLCGLSVYTTAIPKAELKKMYGSKANYVKKVDARLKELEKAGWSLPVYHDLIVADARKVEF